MNTTTTRAAFLAKQAEELAAFDREAEACAKFPGSPVRVHTWTHGVPWGIYHAETIPEAVALLRTFEFVPSAVARASFTSLDALDALRASDEYRAALDAGKGFEFAGPFLVSEAFGRGHYSAKFAAFIKLSDGTTAKAQVEFPILRPPSLLVPRVHDLRYDHGEVTSARVEVPGVPHDHLVRYWSEPGNAHLVLIWKSPDRFFATFQAATAKD